MSRMDDPPSSQCLRCVAYRATIDRAANLLHHSFGKSPVEVATTVTKVRKLLREAVPRQKVVDQDERNFFLERVQDGHVACSSFSFQGERFGVYCYDADRCGLVVVADDGRTRLWIGYIDPESSPEHSKIEWVDAPPFPPEEGWNEMVHLAALAR